MSKKCVAFSKSKLGLEIPDNKKAFYAGWDAALAEQAEQEPVAFGCRFQDGSINDCICPEEHDRCEGDYNIPLYAAPVRTKDLTDEELNDIWYGNTKDGWLGLFRAVISADREKNE